MTSPFYFLFKNKNFWVKFENPLKIYNVHSTGEICAVLDQLDSDLRTGKYIAGYISYEAAAGLDEAFNTKSMSSFPLMVFGVFNDIHKIRRLPNDSKPFKMGIWSYSQDRTSYGRSIDKIKKYIEAGDTYQVNYTLRLNADFEGDAFSFFNNLNRNQNAPFASFLKFDNYTICSASPELFFKVQGDKITSRPMKGTANRGLTYEDDLRLKRTLAMSGKEKAENLMIVDMIRNDMGKICKPDSVKVSELFTVEKYPTVWQMISEVNGTSNASFGEIIKALFPCASITGAPKARTMEIINELEKSPRNIYTGTMGYFTPQRKGIFNVAIRTAFIDENKNKVQYGTGSGIVWDSEANNEYDECVVKTAILSRKGIDFDLLETMLFSDNEIFLLKYHLERLKKSAAYFEYPYDEKEVFKHLKRKVGESATDLKIRCMLSKDGQIKVETTINKSVSTPRKIDFAIFPVDINNPFLYHKTTHREVYKMAMKQMEKQKLDDVILLNEYGDITETTIANIVIEKNKNFYTSPLSCGLLNGTFRQYLVDQKMIKEKKLKKRDILYADKIYLINSVQKWNLAHLVNN